MAWLIKGLGIRVPGILRWPGRVRRTPAKAAFADPFPSWGFGEVGKGADLRNQRERGWGSWKIQGKAGGVYVKSFQYTS